MAYPKKIGDVLAQLVARRGYAREQSSAALEAAWQQAAGEQLAKFTRVGSIRGGTLEVTVANNLLVQEMGFQKADLIERLQRLSPDQKITNLRFRVGQVN
jgi:predicted nucleic acid-binding Zn ribbon protein